MTAALRLGVFGRGRLGGAIAARLADQIVWQVAREAPPADPVDAAIEVSSGAAVPARLDWALATGTPLVIGSTGWEMPDLRERVGSRIGVVTAPNFSLGVALLRRLTLVLGRFAMLDTDRDPYVVEHHHARKHDAPSGTARLLAETLLAACPRKRTWRVGGPLDAGDLAVAVLRAGATYSEHRVGLDSPAEVIELVHTARCADAFVGGAVAAARWACRHRGVTTMDDVAAAALDPLFAGLEGEAP